jgi:chorismate synthase
MGDSLCKFFAITSFGDSHGRCVGVIVAGCPAGLAISEEEIQREVDRRKPAAGTGATGRLEEDVVEVLSGVFNGRTTGAPICLLAWNKDVDSSEYEKRRFLPRPGHADHTAFIKYGGFNDFRGGGRFSGRITAPFVMAGAVAKKLLKVAGIEVLAHSVEIGGVRAEPKGFDEIKENVEKNSVRCADLKAAQAMSWAIERVGREGDSIGGVIECVAVNVPVGLGEPVFDTLEGDLAKAFFAIPAVKGVEFGSGFSAARKRGSENNDAFVIRNGRIVAATNNAGGVLGGISNGMPIVSRVAVKPTPSVAKVQQTVNMQTMESNSLEIRGRHDVCIVPRAVPVVEAMMAVILCDFAMRAGIIPRVVT